MTGFNSQSQITVNWQNNGFAKVLSEIKQIEEAAKRLNISGATKKGADGMLKNVKDIDIAQQKLTQNAERLELERLKRVDKLNKEEYNRNKARNKELSRQYKENERNKKKELSDAKKLEDEKTKILNDAQTKQAFLRKQRATNERKEKLARDLKAIQEDRMLTKHQRNIEIAERKKAFAEYEKFVSSSRLKGAINGERIHIGRHGVNSIEGINATNRRIEAENALLNKNSLLANAGGNLSKARIASDEFNRKETERAKRLKDSEANKNLKETERAQRNYKKSEDLLNESKDDMKLSRAESEIRKKRMSEYDKDIQISKLERERHIKDLRESKKQISDQKKLLQKTNETDKDYIKIKTELNTLEANKARIASRFHDSNSNISDAKERKRVHQINRDAQFYTRANVAFTAPAMIGAVNSMKHLKEKEKAMIALTAAMGGDEAKILYDKLLDYSQNSPTNVQEVATSASAMQNYAEMNKQDLFTVTKTIEDALAVSALDVTSKNRARYQLTEMANKGYGTPSQDIMKLFKNAHIPFQKIYKDLFGKKWDGGNIDFKDLVKILQAYNESPYAIEAWKMLKKSYSFQEERLAETSANMSGALGGLINETLAVSDKFSSLSDTVDGARKWFEKRNPDGSQKTSQKAVIGAAVAVAGTLLMGLFNSHKRKAMEFFFKGDDAKFKERFATSYDANKKSGYGKFAKPMAYVGGLGGVGRAALQFGGAALTYEGVNDLIVAKTLKDWGIASGEIIAGMTAMFGPAGTVAGILTSLAKGVNSWLNSLENDPNSWWSKIGDIFGNERHEMDRMGMYEQPAANFDSNGRPAEAKTLEQIAEQKSKNKAAGFGSKTDAEVWDANNENRKVKAKADRDAEIAKAKAVKNAEIAKAKEAGEIKASFINTELKNSANAAQYKKDTAVILNNYINTTATSGISVKSDIETKQIGGQSYPSL